MSEQNSFSIEDLMAGKSSVHSVTLFGKLAEIRNLTVHDDQIARSRAISHMKGNKDLEEYIDLARNPVKKGDSKYIIDDLALSAAHATFSEENLTQRFVLTIYIPGTNKKFFQSSADIRKLPIDMYAELMNVYDSIPKESPSTSEMTADLFEEMYEEFKKKSLDGRTYSQAVMMQYATMVTEKLEAIEK